jgi:hypothetical protein
MEQKADHCCGIPAAHCSKKVSAALIEANASLAGKTVGSRNERIVEIISLFAFTFKIPFH